jgi:hypothetical protein
VTIADAHRDSTVVDAAPREYTPAIYGSLLVTTLIAVQWRYDAVPELIALSLVVSVAVFWLTHVWSRLMDRRVRGPVGRHEAVDLARREAPMLSAVVAPGIILGLWRTASLTVDAAIGIALAASIAQLFLWGLAVGRAAHASWFRAVLVGLVDCSMGVAIVAFKVLVIH